MTERNDTCPCGSGKKFKKCCQTDFTKGGKARIISETVLGNGILYKEQRRNMFIR